MFNRRVLDLTHPKFELKLKIGRHPSCPYSRPHLLVLDVHLQDGVFCTFFATSALGDEDILPFAHMCTVRGGIWADVWRGEEVWMDEDAGEVCEYATE